MCTARICAFVAKINEPCRIDEGTWFGHALYCNGEIVTHCGRRLTNLEVKCGHFEVEVPPGCYVICATWSRGTSSQSLGNHLTHCAIVQVKCGETACVTLFNPSLHTCGTHFGHAIRDAVGAGQLPREALAVAQRAQEAVADLLRYVPAEGFAAQTANLGVEAQPKRPRK